MNVVGVRQFLPTTEVQNGNKLPSQPADPAAVSVGDANISARRVDMRNISPNEINELIRSGVDGLLDMLPIGNIDIIRLNSGSYREGLANQKIDFIGQVEKSIEFSKSINRPTDRYEKMLANLYRINGIEFPPKTDIVA